MVHITSSLQPIVASEVNLYHTLDPLLSNLPILVFHGASTTTNATHSNSRIQIHIVHPGGAISYPRLTVSPNSPIYEVVDELPREWQGDEVCRGLAFGIMKYFGEMAEGVKSALIVQNVASQRGRRPASAIPMFGKEHAANIASSLVKVENASDIIKDLEAGLQGQVISNVDVDLVLPPGSIRPLTQLEEDDDNMDDEFDPLQHQYGQYAPLIRLFGETCFLPTSKVKRAPSRAASMNRSRSFLRDQKLSLRREMGEFVDTEERYVIKIHELVNNIAEEFRTSAKRRLLGSSSPSEEDIKKLFPPSLDAILKANKGFLADIQKVMDDTEEEAMQDLEDDQPMFLNYRNSGTGKKDPTGAAQFSKVLLEWFPRFSDCYQDYIRSSQDFPQLISHFVRQQSSFSSRVQHTGEQKLRSAIIEPVQRLPRYSLFIDNIVNYLPIAHPSTKAMLRARDIITAICSLDPIDGDTSQVVVRLKNVVGKWPATFTPHGRLISAADYAELPPPYHAPEDAVGSGSGILLLFADTVVVCKKNRDSAISARGVMAEVDKPSAASMMASVAAGATGSLGIPDLAFVESYTLQSIRFSESEDNRVVWMTTSASVEREPTPGDRRAFLMRGSHEGKASKWSEEVTKARIEGRFGEKERMSDKWELRQTLSRDVNLNVYAAVYEEGLDTLIEGRKEPAPIRIVVDREKGTKGAPIGHYGVEIIANLTVTEAEGCLSYHVKFEGLGDRNYNDFADDATFVSVFTKRIGLLLQNQLQPRNPAITSSFISYHTKILHSLDIQTPQSEKPKYQRPASPVKILSSFLSGASLLSVANSGDSTKSKRTPVLGAIPNFAPPSLSRSSSKKDIETLERPAPSNTSSFRLSVDENNQVNPLVKLEETFNGYVAALQERKGNMVSRVIRNRAAADELSVNAIYNTFIENPFDMRQALQVSVDVLFCAFEKFLHMAWHDQMGPVISIKMLEQLQKQSAKLFPGDFADFMKIIFNDMAPQNRRAFVAIVKLLADLLEGCGNDGDRGALTAAFTEMLVVDADPHRYINLLDRLVEDADRLFEDYGPANPDSGRGDNGSLYGSINSTMRNHASHAKSGSITSNTSSFRKRWGFDTLLRTNSKKDDDDKKPSVWRTLSKKDRKEVPGEATPTGGSLSRGSLHRSKSIDYGRGNSPQRPNSSSNPRPTVVGAFDEDQQRPNTSHSPLRSLLGGSPLRDTIEEKRSKKSRRSSLSDLKTLMDEVAIESSPAPSPAPAPLSVQKPNQIPKPTFNPTSSPQTPSPPKPSLQRQSIYNNSPGSVYSMSPKQKENAGINAAVRSTGSLAERSNNLLGTDIVTISDLWAAQKPPLKPTVGLSGIPLLRKTPGGPKPLAPAPEFGKPAFQSTLAQRKATSPPTHLPVPVSPEAIRQKLRLQSPQKLRERLQNEAKAINEAESHLQTELSKIGEEMARLCGGNGGNNSSPGRTNSGSIGDLRRLTDSVKSLESRIPVVIKDLSGRNEAVKKEMEKSLVAAETKVRGLDQLYKEASAENELLYERFNNELGKIVAALKSRGKDDKHELMAKMKEAMDETAKTKKDNARLKREIVSLKTALRAAEMK